MNPTSSLSRQQIRRYDEVAMAYGIPGPVLMENAGRGAVEVLLAQGLSGSASIVCGKGNNGGDGFVIARWLHALGMEVSVELIGDPEELRGDAATAFKPLLPLGIAVHRFDEQTAVRLSQCQWIVDALLGTGSQGSVRSPFDQAISLINQSGRKVLAVDLPSGLDCDTGMPLSDGDEAVIADCTATFVARKRGFDNLGSSRWTGTVHVVSIGVGHLELDC